LAYSCPRVGAFDRLNVVIEPSLPIITVTATVVGLRVTVTVVGLRVTVTVVTVYASR
jgi:hypothetical protein